jgi:exopolysaccharide biosynthesis protein
MHRRKRGCKGACRTRSFRTLPAGGISARRRAAALTSGSNIMKKISQLLSLALWLSILFVFAAAQEFKTIEDGVEYAELTRGTKDEPVRINLLKLDLTKVRLDVVHATDAAIGLEKTSAIATRHGALAAINAGFFRLDTSVFAGEAAGVLVIDNHLLSESVNNRIALFIDNFEPDRTIVKFAHLNINQIVRIKNKEFRFSGVNRERKENELIKYTPYFHRTTLTGGGGVEIVVKKGKIAEVNDNKGNSVIPQDGFVISATGKMRDEILPFLKVGRKIREFTVTPFEAGQENFSNDGSNRTAKAFSRAEDVTNGVPQLIKDGKIEITWEQEKSSKAFVETRHPRTAVAILKDGKFLMMTVDGRQPNVSVGMNLNELAAFLLELGATDAINLDGGGSTTMYLGGKVVNKPSDKEGERRVGDAILVFPRRK